MRRPFSLKPPRIVPKGANIVRVGPNRFRTSWDYELSKTRERILARTHARECERRLRQKGTTP